MLYLAQHKARECISAVLSDLFKLVDTVCSGKDASQKLTVSEVSKKLAVIEGSIDLKTIIALHGEAVDFGFISVNRLIEVTVQPLVKLASKINMAEHSVGTLDEWQVGFSSCCVLIHEFVGWG